MLKTVLVDDPLRLTSYTTNWLKYRKYISSHLDSNHLISNADEIDNNVSNLNVILEQAAIHATHRQIKATNSLNTYTNREIEHLVSEKRRFRREWQRNRSPAARLRLTEATKRLQSALRKEDSRQQASFIASLTPTASTKFSLWKTLRNTSMPTETQFPIRDANGKWAISKEEKANVFANHLSQVFRPNPASSDILPPVDKMSAVIPLFTNANEVLNVIKETVNPGKAPGYDLITPKMILELPYIAVKFLAKLFNSILRHGYFPKVWKISLIQMILKPGKDKSIPSSYRPISLLPCLSKLFEKVLLSKIKPFLVSNNIIPDHQFGFREGHSTIEQVNRLTQAIEKSFERREYCCAVFLDVAQAFDKVWHFGLTYKICKYLPANTHRILESYLENRRFRVKCGQHVTDDREILAGVPQGSVMGPILYILITADIPTSPNVLTSTFADDTAIMATHKKQDIASMNLGVHLRQVESWLSDWRIKVNEAKCTQVTFTLNFSTCPTLKLNNIPFSQSDHVSYLGIHLDRRLTWRSHIEAKKTQLQLKVHQLHWLLNANSKLSLEYKVLLYNSAIKPIWLYGAQLWGKASSSNLDKIQRVQSKTLRLITGAPWYMRNENIHRDLKIPLVKEAIQKINIKHKEKFERHDNILARQLLCSPSSLRLRRNERRVF